MIKGYDGQIGRTLCVECEKQGHKTRATIYERVVPYDHRGSRVWRIEASRPLCRACFLAECEPTTRETRGIPSPL